MVNPGTAHKFFSMFLREVRESQGHRSDGLVFEKNHSDGNKGDYVSKYVFWSTSFKVFFEVLHDCNRQQGPSFEYDAILWENLNPRLFRGLDRD